jgi:hypothetical protein
VGWISGSKRRTTAGAEAVSTMCPGQAPSRERRQHNHAQMHSCCQAATSEAEGVVALGVGVARGRFKRRHRRRRRGGTRVGDSGRSRVHPTPRLQWSVERRSGFQRRPDSSPASTTAWSTAAASSVRAAALLVTLDVVRGSGDE